MKLLTVLISFCFHIDARASSNIDRFSDVKYRIIYIHIYKNK